MDLGEVLSNYTYLFILIMLRYSGLFLITPIFGSRIISTRVKIGLAFFLALTTFPVLKEKLVIAVPVNGFFIMEDVTRELAIGFFMGFIVFIVFSAIQLAGQFIDLRLGFAMASVIDPLHGSQAPLMGQFKNVLATLVFLAINGHHILLKGIYKSFAIIPLGSTAFSGMSWQFIFRITSDIFIIAFRIALPVIGTVFIVDIILGFLARTMPQMNIFVVGLPLKNLVGFIILLLSLNVTIYYYHDLFAQMFEDMFKFINLLKPQ